MGVGSGQQTAVRSRVVVAVMGSTVNTEGERAESAEQPLPQRGWPPRQAGCGAEALAAATM